MTIDTGLPPLKDGVSFTSHLFLVLFLGLIAGAGYWAWSGTLAVVSVAEGEVVPSSQVKSIQHLEGGIVRLKYRRDRRYGMPIEPVHHARNNFGG